MDHSHNRKECLVLTTVAPLDTEIHHHNDGLIEYVVRPPLEVRGFTVTRMDEIAAGGTISDAVIRELYSAEVVIADLSFADPMVMYALGIRHSFDLPVIHLLTPSSVFPFDVEGLSAITYDIADMTSVRRARRELAQRVVEPPSPAKASPVHATVELDRLVNEGQVLESDSDRIVANGLRAIEQRLTGIERRLGQLDRQGDGQPGDPAAVTISRRVFIVHGHDGELKHQLARFLRRLKFEPVILQELPDSGRTLIEKLRAEVADIGFAFVILTPDDLGRALVEDVDKLGGRARQNVIFEHGLFSALLDPTRVCAIRRGEVEIPSDLHGLVIKHIPEGGGIDSVSLGLVRELQRAGYDVDANLLMEG